MPQTETIGKTEVHEAASMFPLLKAKEFEDLCKDIQKNGITQPLVYRNGTLIDGRNRLRAAIKLGLPEKDIPKHSLPATTTDADVLEYIYGANILRRHLTEAQRAALKLQIMEASGELAKLEKEAAKLREENRSKQGRIMADARKAQLEGKPVKKTAKGGKQRGLVVKTLAKKANVSEPTADAVNRLRKKDPAKFASLVAGKKTDQRGKGPRTMWRVPQDPKPLASFLVSHWSVTACRTLIVELQDALKQRAA